MTPNSFQTWLLQQESQPGALYKVLEDGTYVLAKRLLFHWTVIQGTIGDTTGYEDRWCFATENLAKKAVNAWPASPPPGYEPTGWHRHPKSGRRRDMADPNREHIAF